MNPSLSDFITTGGLVTGDRFQFFVWTIIACGGFLGLLVSADPSGLRALPDIPQGLLLLMGISATGYLGGKVVRLPGPVFRQIKVTNVLRAVPPNGRAQLTLSLRGDNLSKNGTLKVDGVNLASYQYSVDASTPQAHAPDPALCSELVVTLKEADAYLTNIHGLVLTNDQDGQMAECEFPLNPLTIAKAQIIAAGDEATTVAIKGTNFCNGMIVTWTNSGTETRVPPNGVVRKSDTEVDITLVPGTAGSATLTIESALGLIAREEITVKAADQVAAAAQVPEARGASPAPTGQPAVSPESVSGASIPASAALPSGPPAGEEALSSAIGAELRNDARSA